MVTYKIGQAIYVLFLATVALALVLDNITVAEDAGHATVTKTVQFTIFEVQNPASSPTSISITSESATVLQQLQTSVHILSIGMTGDECETTLPGMVMQPCALRPPPSSIEPGSLAALTQLATNAVVITQTITSTVVAGPETKTVTRVLTPEAGSSSIATGFCFWDEQQILMPCTNMVAATAKPSISAAFRTRINPLEGIVRYMKNAVSQ